jgi:CheY-like chemotaxis protein
MSVLAHEAPHLLVSDIGMPVTDGYALLRRVRALEGDRGTIPAIAVTAYARREDKLAAEQAGFQAHLTKPVDAGELQGMVERLLRREATTTATEPARS